MVPNLILLMTKQQTLTMLMLRLLRSTSCKIKTKYHWSHTGWPTWRWWWRGRSWRRPCSPRSRCCLWPGLLDKRPRLRIRNQEKSENPGDLDKFLNDGTFFTGKFYRTDTESTAHGVAAIELNSASHTAGLNLIVVVTNVKNNRLIKRNLLCSLLHVNGITLIYLKQCSLKYA